MTITKITAINALANVIMNLILIPKFSYIGASIATVITEFSALIFGIVVCSNLGYGLSKKNLIGLSKITIASLPMSILIICLRDLNLLFLVLLSAGLYFFILYLLSWFEEEDIEIVRSIVSGSGMEK
jgi:O-antigen/teichoic acid export membrane protein